MDASLDPSFLNIRYMKS